MESLAIITSDLPIAIQNAATKYKLTPAQVSELEYAVRLSGMSPPHAMTFLSKYSPEQVTSALSIRSDFLGSTLPSVPDIIRAMEATFFPTDRVPDKTDFDAVFHAIRPRRSVRERINYVANPSDGGSDRDTYYQSFEGTDVTPEGSYYGYRGEDDYDDESFA